MYFKVLFHCFILVSAVAAYSVGHYPKFCSDCEEEVWEEVPCNPVPTTTPAPTPTSTTPSTDTTSSTTTAASPPIAYTRPSYPITPTSATPNPIDPINPYYPPTESPLPNGPSTTPAPAYAYPTKDPYKKCYCDCKVGCKEFCNNVNVDHDPSMQIIQITKTLQNLPDGRRLEVKHEHRYLPRLSYPSQPIEVPVYGDSLNEINASGNNVDYQPGLPTNYDPTAGYPSGPKTTSIQDYSSHFGLDDELRNILQNDHPNVGYENQVIPPSVPIQSNEPIYNVERYPGPSNAVKRHSQGIEPELGSYLNQYVYSDNSGSELSKKSEPYVPVKSPCPSKPTTYQNIN